MLPVKCRYPWLALLLPLTRYKPRWASPKGKTFLQENHRASPLCCWFPHSHSVSQHNTLAFNVKKIQGGRFVFCLWREYGRLRLPFDLWHVAYSKGWKGGGPRFLFLHSPRPAHDYRKGEVMATLSVPFWRMRENRIRYNFPYDAVWAKYVKEIAIDCLRISTPKTGQR